MSNASPTPPLTTPPGFARVALALQGGGALGAYQAGVYEALHEAGLRPDFVAGVSIGGINAAIIAGNKPDLRLQRLREFWNTVTTMPEWPFPPIGDAAQRLRADWGSMAALLHGRPGFFTPNLPNPWFMPRGAPQATAFYDSGPLRETLLRLVDFDLLNAGATRFAAGAVHVTTGNFCYFDSTTTTILPEHIMASGALPPGLPMVRLGTDHFWDGGLVSNTPLQHLLDNIGSANTMVFQVDLFSARGPAPRDMADVLARQKDITYSSRTRMITDHYMALHRMRLKMRDILARVPEPSLSDDDRALQQELADLPEIAILHLIYQQAAHEGHARDYDFSAHSMRQHWASGLADTRRTLARQDWMRLPDADEGIVVHDVHRTEA